MGRLDKNIAEFGHDDLIVDVYPPADVFAVSLAAGEGLLKRGTLLARSQKDGSMSIFGTAAAEGDALTANCVLTDDTELDPEGPTEALAYRTGHFAANVLIVKEGCGVTDDDKEELRKHGILLSDALKG
jgi:hypothetical protein